MDRCIVGLVSPTCCSGSGSVSISTDSAQPGQLARFLCASQRTGQHPRERDVPNPRSEFGCGSFASRGQWKVGSAGISPGERPFGFTVSKEINAQQHGA
jgi:hypothetical protein